MNLDRRLHDFGFNLDYPEDLVVLKKVFDSKIDKTTHFEKNELLAIVQANLEFFDTNKNMVKQYQTGELASKLKNLTTRKAKS